MDEALILIKVKSDTSPTSLMQDLIKLDEAVECMFVGGEWPLILRVKVNDLSDLPGIIINKLAKYNIEDTDTWVILQRVSKNGEGK